MTQQVLILGGTRRIGSQIAADLLAHTAAQVTIAGRNPEVGVKLSQAVGRSAFSSASLSLSICTD